MYTLKEQLAQTNASDVCTINISVSARNDCLVGPAVMSAPNEERVEGIM